MKKKIVALVMVLLMFAVSVSQAATYTLPEKMRNQLAIGSGLKGTFTLTAEGEKTNTPFLNAVTDAEFSVRGMSSGEDFHYYVFQADENENQSAVTELYRKDGICYLRSDMVQGRILAFPTSAQAAESLFRSKGENPSIASFLVKILTIPEKEMNDKWKPVLNRYQNELEMWLADFTVQADIVKTESGNSALDFTYVIPMDQVKTQTITLFREFTRDPEAMALLDTVMTPEEKAVYANGNLIFYYEEALAALDLTGEVRMNKRVSAMGDVLSSMIEMPLDLKTTGYSKLIIESRDKATIYRLSNEEQAIAVALPAENENQAQEYQKSIWYTNVCTSAEEGKTNLSIRIDIRRASKQDDDEAEKSHLEEHYTVTVVQDETYLPEGFDTASLTPVEEINAELDLHYSSKYSQNSATTLEVRGSVRQGGSAVNIEGTLKTAAPWLFMPFEVIDPIRISADHPEALISYFADWISNAPSMIRHGSGTETEPAAQQEEKSGETESEPAENEEAEAVPLDEGEPETIEEKEESAEPLDEGESGPAEEKEESAEPLDANTGE